MENMEKFRALGLSENTLAALQKKGWETPSTIQEKTIPLLLKDERDVVGQAQTGTGKTGAFGLPLIEKLDDSSKKVQALIMCPTRELAIQVAEEISSFKGTKRFWVQSVYGGASFSTQARALEKGTQIVVGTPGRIRDHIERKTLKLDAVTHVVLDEADEMLNMGFEEEVREILKSVPQQKRMLLFSATMPSAILKIAKTFMGEYDLIEVEKKLGSTELVDQIYFEVRDHDRFETLCRVIDTEPEFYGIVFCRTKAETDNVADKLMDRGYDAEAIHGDVTQNQRELTLKKFKLKKVTILVATDVAARGIDVNDLTHVVNYNLPQDPEAYVHRIGRTGRAGKHGTAISIVSPSERRSLMFMQKQAKSQIRKEEVPGIDVVIETKKMKLKTDLVQLLEHKSANDYLALAAELLEDDREPAQLVSALLNQMYKDTLKESSYREVGKMSSQGGSSSGVGNDQARLFVAKGHTSSMNSAKVIEFIASETGIDPQVIHDVRVYDNFSFITLPHEQAEVVLGVFGANKRGGKPLVTRAKDKDSSGGGGGRRFEGGGGGGFKKEFRGEKKSFGDRKPYSSDRSEGGERTERPNRVERKDYGDKKPYGERTESGDKKKFTPASGGFKKDFAKKEYVKKEFVKSEGTSDERPVRKRENKLTDYLEKKPATDTKPSKKKAGATGDLENFMKKFSDDDLSW
ncbi:MAG TPA: DEAD/DEAH box helicase [Chitinophagales bacterium]|nr:DEAD/DEAH box helicase [Chitinophagales bacterium]